MNERRSSLRWDELPHTRWAIEISTRCGFRPPEMAHLDARGLLLRDQLPQDKSVHHEFMSHEAGEIIYELRACRDVYRTGLVDVNKTLSTKIPPETLFYYAVEYGVVPRAASLIRTSLIYYFQNANIPFDAVRLLFDRHAGSLVIPTRESANECSDAENQLRVFRGTESSRKEPANDWPELLQRMIPDALLQGLNRKSSYMCGEPFHLNSAVRSARSQHEVGLPPQLFDLVYRRQEWWMSHTGFLWDSIVEEIKRQHGEVEIEIFGRQLEDCERTNVEKVIHLYSELKARNGSISDEDLLKVASLADQLGLRPAELMGTNGRDCLRLINTKRRKSLQTIATVSDVVRENRPMAPHRRSLKAFFTKFLSDRLSSHRKP